MRTLKEIKADIRETRKEMKAKGIKRTSCFNGGLYGEVYSYNARMFALETEKIEAARNEQSEAFWSYRAASETPSLEQAIAAGAIKSETTIEQWEAFSPGMRREIVRTANKHNQR